MASLQLPHPSAPESSAGDDFHLLWASRKLLELLRPNNSLTAVAIEGVSPQEADIVDPSGDQLLGVDLSEYYGGQTFEEAKSVVYSQLKYSTRHSSANWTAARLAETTNRKRSNSVIKRLLSTKNELDILDFCTDLPSGIVVRNNHVSFKDEDFEVWLQQKYKPNNSDYSKLADTFLERSINDVYAASHLADSLLHAGRKEELVALVHREDALDAINDRVTRTNISARRAELALRIVLENKDPAELIRMLLVVARSSRTDRTVEKLLLNNADLACRYGNATAVQGLYLNPKNQRGDWYGPEHLLCAANFSRNDDMQSFARESLKSAIGCINYRAGLPKEKREEYPLSSEDIAYGVETILRLDGYVASIAWLSKWRPRSILFNAFRAFVSNLIALEGVDAFKWFDHTKIRADWLLVIIDVAITEGLNPPEEIVHRAMAIWNKLEIKGYKPSVDLTGFGLSLCEAAALYHIDASKIRRLLPLFTPKAPEYCMRHYLHEYAGEYDLWMRYKALYATINSEDLKGTDVSLLPVRFQIEPTDVDHIEKRKWEEEKKEFHTFYEFLIPAYLLRAKALFIKCRSEKFEKEIKDAIKLNAWDWSPRGRFASKTV